MFEFVFLGKSSDFGDFPDLITKAFTYPCHKSESRVFSEVIVDSDISSIFIVSLTDLSAEEVLNGLKRMTKQSVLLFGNRETFKKYDKELGFYSMKLAGTLDSDSSPTMQLATVNNALNYLQIKHKVTSLSNLGKELSAIDDLVKKDEEKLKIIHSKMVPIRRQTHKGVDLSSKFAAGTSSGGEFFDHSIEESFIRLFLISTQSYVVTSYYLTLLGSLKPGSGDTDIKKFIESVQGELRGAQIVDEGSSLLFLELDLKTMSISGYNFGGHAIFVEDKILVGQNKFPVDWNFCEQSKFDFKLQRGEKLSILSEGIFSNAAVGRVEVPDVIKETHKLESEEVFNELFFQIKKHQNSKFMDHDATMIMIEVQNNAIFSV